MTKTAREALRACLTILLVASVPTWVEAQTDQTVEAPVVAQPADGVALFGELISIGPSALVLRETKLAYPPNARFGDAPITTTTDVVIQIPEGTPLTYSTPDGLTPGTRIFVGAREIDGVLTALLVHDIASLNSGQAADPEAVRAELKATVENAIATSMRNDPSLTAGDSPNCLAANAFQPNADTLDFKGCYGGPSLNASASFSPVKVYSNGNPLLGIPDSFALSVNRFELNLGLAGWNYEFPFKFSAVDPAQLALDAWARECLAVYGSVEVGICPLARPYVPGPTQPRNIELNVTPLAPLPAASMNGGLGGAIGFGFIVYFGVGCGASRLEPCTFTFFIDFGPFSQFQRATGLPPLGPGQSLRGEANACIAVGGSLVLGVVGVPIGVSTLISPFDVLYCLPFELYNQTQPGFSAAVANLSSDGQTQGTLTDISGNVNPRVTFTGGKQYLRLAPGSSGRPTIRFQQFSYRLDWRSKIRIDLRSSFVTWFRGPEWDSGLTKAMPFIDSNGSGSYTPLPGEDGSGLPKGHCNDFFVSLNAPAFTARQPICIDIDIPQAEFGNASVASLNPVAASSDGGTVVRVTGSGFLSTTKPDGSAYPGTGVTRVVLHRLDDNTEQEVSFTVVANDALDLTMPAHPPTLFVDENGGFDHGTSAALTFYAWGTTFNKNIYYAARPTIGSITVLDGSYTPEEMPPTGSERGGERVALAGRYIGKVTDVYFGGTRVPFVECHEGQTSPLCAGAPGVGGLYSTIVARASAGPGAIADCPSGSGTRCDEITVRSACFGNDFAQGRPAPGAYCGTSLVSENARYVRKRRPEITSLTPAGGPPGTSMQVTITGVGFTGLVTVRIGNTTLSGICNLAGCPGTPSDTQLVVTVPAAAVGTSQITVTNPCPAAFATRCGESDPASFRHLDTPLVTSLSPAQGTFDGGTLVTVTGQGFGTATALNIGGVNVPFTLDGTTPDTKLRFTTPRGYPDIVAGLPATANVVITVACGTLASTNANACGVSGALPYTYLPPEIRERPLLSLDQITGEVGRSAPLRGILTTPSGVPLPGRILSFFVLGASVGTATTDSNGVASMNAVMPVVGTGAYAEQTVARFDGDAAYLAVEQVNWLILTNPEVVAWGHPLYPYYTEVPALLQGVVAVAAGGNHTMALKLDGTVVTWGNSQYDITPPVGLNNVAAIAAGYSHSLALKSDGTVVKWGIGGGTKPALPPVQRISAGLNLSVVVTTAGALAAWAVSPTNPATLNLPAPGGDPFIAASAGLQHGLGLRQSGTVTAWGDNTGGMATVPAGLTNVVAVAAGYNGSLALRGDGTVVGWGAPTTQTVCPPFPCAQVTVSRYQPPADLTGIVAIAASPDGQGGVGLRSDKTMVAWSTGNYRALNAPAGYASLVESFSVGGDNSGFIYVALRKPRLDTTLTVDPVTGFAGDAVTLRGALKTGTEGDGLSDRDINFSLNGAALGTGTRIGHGMSTFATTIPAITPGVYPSGVQADFPTPSAGLVGSSGSAQLLVRGHQTLTFDPLADRGFVPTPFTVSAQASSTLPVTFSASGGCSIATNEVTLTGLGTCTITASQAGDLVYTAAASVPRSFEVARSSQTLTFDPLVNAWFGEAPQEGVAAATSGLPVVLTSLTPSVCSAIGVRITNLAVGVCAVAADQPGSANYFPAARIIRNFTITLDAFDLARLPSQLDPPSGQLAGGVSHTCALTTTGGVKCWGDNSAGQLGDGSTTQRLMAVDVTNLGGPAIALSAGGAHTCAVLATGSVTCWGGNANGELGNNSTSSATTPVTVSGLSNAVGIATGQSHTCALTAAGRVMCWGRNDNGQLGHNSTAQSLVPVDVSGSGGTGVLVGVTAISAGAAHTCAITAAGGAYCWGKNDEGQLGSGSLTSSTSPRVVSGPGGTESLAGVRAIASGDAHTCALLGAGAPFCWGRNTSGQLGTGTTMQASSPVSVAGVAPGATGIAAGGNHTCLVTASDGVACFGLNADGQVGDGSTQTRLAPVPAAGLPFGMMRIAAGANHTCALTTSGGVKCWGSNTAGQLGSNSLASQSRFVDVPGLSAGAASVGLGIGHTCAITAGGGVRCWGNNDIGQLGDGTVISKATPTDVSGLTSGVAALASGLSHTCALTQAGGVKCWGWNSSGALGDGTNVNRTAPVDVIGLSSGVARIAAGEYHTCALLTAGGLKCWGSNNFGQLGDSTFSDRNMPVDLTNQVSGVVSLVSGNSFNCVVTSDGAAKCWGRNSSGQLGDGTTTVRSTPPVDVIGLGSGVLGMGAGSEHACAFLDTGVTRCWGSNTDGQLGDGSQTDRLTPVELSVSLPGVSALALGGNNTCAMAAGGAVRCFGRNVTGQLGDGTTVGRIEATEDVVGLAQGAGALAGASGRNCAITGAGGVKCWGSNGQGQIDGTYTNYLASVDVRGGQSIYFAAPSAVERLQQLPVEAIVTSGLAATLESLTPSVCTIGGSGVTGVSQGLCAVRALQAGNAAFAPAPPQLRLIPVTAIQYTITASAGTNGSIDPTGDLAVSEGTSRQFMVTPNPGYATVVTGTCGGILSGTSFTTSLIAGNCSVIASFVPITMAIGDVAVVEGDSGTVNASFTVTLSAASVHTITVSAHTENGTASAGSDYTAVGPTTLTFDPGDLTRTFTVAVKGDVLDEPDETFFVILSDVTNAVISDGSGLGTITDDDLSTLSIADATLVEGNSGTTNMVFTVTLSTPASSNVTVSATTSNGSAIAGSDYTATGPTTLTFVPGVLTRTFNVPILGDTLSESNETFSVTLSSPANALIEDGMAVGTITNDDAPPPSRVFVSVAGNDANTCSDQTAPCRTIAAALNQVAIDGEVIVLSSGDYATAPISIVRGVKISSPAGTVAFVRQPIIVNAPLGRVVLYGLTLKGSGSGNGITLSAADSLSIEGTTLDRWDVGLSIEAAGTTVTVLNSVFRASASGVRAGAGSLASQVAVEESRFEGNGTGIEIAAGTFTLRETVLVANSTAGLTVGPGSASIYRSEFLSNAIGVKSVSGGAVKMGRSRIFGNTLGVSAAAGSMFASAGTNALRGNGTDISGAITVIPEQ